MSPRAHFGPIPFPAGETTWPRHTRDRRVARASARSIFRTSAIGKISSSGRRLSFAPCWRMSRLLRSKGNLLERWAYASHEVRPFTPAQIRTA